MAAKQRRKTRMTVTVRVIRLFDTPTSGFLARLSRKGAATGRKGLSHPSKGLKRSDSGVDKLRYAQGKKRGERWPQRLHKLHGMIPNAGSQLSNMGKYNVQSILQALDSDRMLSISKRPLSLVCSDDSLLLRNKDPDLEGGSLEKIFDSLLLVQAAIRVLSAVRLQHGADFIIEQGEQIGLRIDETCIANYEHLLLRLETQLLEALTRKSAAASRLTDLDKTQRKQLNWFSEFPDGQRPLSTTWPWSIKPSLAVLWGVCWMFPVLPGYDQTEQQAHQAASTRLRIPGEVVLQDEQLNAWGYPQPNEWSNYGRRCLENTPGIRAQIGSPSHSVGHNASCVGNGEGDGGGSSFHNMPMPMPRNRGAMSRGGSAQPHYLGGSELPRQQTYYQGVPPPDAGQHNGGPYSRSIPRYSGIATQAPEFAFTPQHQQLDVDSLQHSSWSLAPQNTQSTLPQQFGGHLTSPLIALNGELQHQNQYLSHLNPNPYQQHHQPRELHLNTAFSTFGTSPHTMGDCPVPGSSPINTIQHERKISLNSNSTSNIPTPVSMGPLSPQPHVSPSRSREPSTPSSQGRPSVDPPSQDGEEEEYQRQKSFKRAEEPQRNQHGKMICVRSTCVGITFDRRCEWSKHMDKHERPYKCTRQGCEKLRGFTYSGGLLRHEREVHKLHGGTKEPLFCPFPDCKRSGGEGFTRRENQQEHIRRVHRSSSSSQGPASKPAIEPSQAVIERPPKAEPPRQAPSYSEPSHANSLKRKRISEPEHPHEEGPMSLYDENKRLRQEVQDRDAKILQLQSTIEKLTQTPR